ncbi:hypothetical protein IAR50_002298 [Cryptococcus sp. DSM 104548]
MPRPLPAMVALVTFATLLTTRTLAAPSGVQRVQLQAERGLGDKSYAPYEVPCPTSDAWVRNATTGLASAEQDYINQRKNLVESAVQKTMVARGLDNPPRTPNIGVAISGGGYRTMLVGLGGVMGLMNESSEAASSGTGGWLEATNYMAGLSGGSWAVGSFVANGGALPSKLLEDLYNLDSNLIFPSSDKIAFYTELFTESNAKMDQGFPVQLTDIWGLAIGAHVMPDDHQLDKTPNFTLSNLDLKVPAYANASLPLPIIIAAEREPGELLIAENATVYELTPYEFGSWAFGSDYKSPGAFTPMQYLGTSLNNGTTTGTCWKGYDQLSFAMGTSATLFNAAFLELNGTNTDLFGDFLKDILQDLGNDELDVSRVPNPFASFNPDLNPVSSFDYITLIDAGETNQNLPLEPFIQQTRKLDAIIAFDASGDTDTTWPNGSAPRTTFERAQVLSQYQNMQVRMPEVPSENGFVNGGFNSRPTFFGCNDTDTPMLVYIPSYPWSVASNTSTFQLQYSTDEALDVMLSGMRSLTLNGTVDTWPTCLACALTDRAFEYTNSNRSSACQACFDTWCWDGSDNTTEPAVYAPEIGSVPLWLVEQRLAQ